ncbi:MAG: methyltransferase family protein [Promethearchaeota archaeon]
MNDLISYVQLHRNIEIAISPIVILIGIYSIIKTKQNYESNHKRSKITSTLSVLYHNGFVAIVSYSAFFSTLPFFDESSFYGIHLFFFNLGVLIGLSSIILYVLYIFKIESVSRALGITSDKLITDGIFQKSRNPQSLARIIELISLGVCGRSFYSLLLAMFWIFFNHYNILNKEKFLEMIFGDRYLEYYSFTPRYCGILNSFKKK